MAIFVWLINALVGESVIRCIHEGHFRFFFGESPILNPQKPVDFYLRLAQQAGRGGLLFVLLGVGTIQMFRYLLTDPANHSRFLAGFAVFIFAAVYLLNPNNRIVSIHGFMHTGIVYQILHGGLPPTNPLLAGEPLLYPWGHHFLAAILCQVFRISPAWSFAFLNILSLTLCIILIAAISRRLTHNSDSHVFSVLVGLFASTVMNRSILEVLSSLIKFQIDWRAIPPGLKFVNMNGAPIGILFFLLSVLSLIRLAQNHHSRRYTGLLFLAVVGCGFTYPLMFPAVCASCGLTAVVLAVSRREFIRQSISVLVRILIPLGLGVVSLIPYLRLISGSDAGAKIQFFQPFWLLLHGVVVLVMLWPIFLLIFLERKTLQRWNPEVAMILITVTLTCFACYFSMHMFHQAEYKSLILAGIGVGFFGGMAFSNLRSRLHPFAWILLLLLFLFPMMHCLIPIMVSHSWVRTPVYREEGTTLGYFVPQQDQLYQWIRDETPSDSVFLDSSLDIPVFGRRSLYIGWDGQNTPGFLQTGYNITMEDLLGRQSGYNPEVLASRNRIQRAVYSSHQSLNSYDLAELRRFNPVYIVIRDPGLFPRFAGEDFERVFSTSSDQIRVFRLRTP